MLSFLCLINHPKNAIQDALLTVNTEMQGGKFRGGHDVIVAYSKNYFKSTIGQRLTQRNLMEKLLKSVH